eukprot:CAMPEP_0201660890 /NCGR_PEP_ID=MMETSP0494-20130426/3406_1 /ASSEMBLY_ACC=CAM_ASM_000839 /TAXON_ID=420259 /ORGANISM="Thalassiosira gravida, Strain GMp14c1" /LENGTH=447 /DNA_ID=CAMNT_0048138867 /DNA_START=97 /DNA_END=1440 /DNA_ORIENTATION=+
MKTASAVETEEKASSSACTAPTQTSSSSSLSIFHEDVILSIISYIADVPFELVDTANNNRSPIDSHSTLTHTLPLVSKQFHKLTRQYDLHWKSALLRLVRNEPLLWEEGMKRIIFDARCDEIRAEIGERSRTRRAAAASTTAGRSRRDKRTRDGEQLNQRQEENNTPQSVAVSNNAAAAEEEEQSTVNNPTDDNNNNETTTTPSSSSLKEEQQLLQKACTAIQLHAPHHHTATSSGLYQCLYQSILQTHIRYQAPVFIMPSPVRLGETYGLHFFEPRYRILIAEVMANQLPVSARRGGRMSPLIPGLFPLPSSSTQQQLLDDDIKCKISELLEENNDDDDDDDDAPSTIVDDHYYPMFIHAHQAPLRRNVPATIVRVEQCAIQPDGSADVFMTPMAYIWLEEIWERPGTGGLVEARGVRMGMDSSESYECWCATGGEGGGWSRLQGR